MLIVENSVESVEKCPNIKVFPLFYRGGKAVVFNIMLKTLFKT